MESSVRFAASATSQRFFARGLICGKPGKKEVGIVLYISHRLVRQGTRRTAERRLTEWG